MAEQAGARQQTASSDSAGEHFESHGHSLASWVLVALVLVGAFVVSLGLVLTVLWLDIVGAVVIVLGLIVGRLLQMAGFGVHPPGARSH
jgi:uncharacterized protein DUF6704